MTGPGAPVPLGARALAPDVARGAMLLLIALANVHLYLYDRPLGVRLYPAGLIGADRVIAGLQLALVDGRAYPLFGVLFGYGIGQWAARRAGSEPAVVRTVRRRGAWLVVIGAAHVVLLWPGDIVSAYGLLGVVLGGLLVAGTAVSVATMAAVGTVLTVLLGAFSGFSPPGATAPIASIAIADPLTAAVARVGEWVGGVLLSSTLTVVGAVALGAWAARYRLLDEPGQHRDALRRVAVGGLAAAVLAGLPLALAGAGVWRPGTGALLLVGALHALGGYAGGLGYAAAFGLLTARGEQRDPGTGDHPETRHSDRPTALSAEPVRRECPSSDKAVAGPARPGPVLRALAVCGQRSLSCYLAQSVAFATLLPAWTLGLGARLTVAQAALLAAAVWLVLVLVSAASARSGYRGPAEILLRRLTYGAGTIERKRRSPG
jgi:uncharacterized protein